MKNYAREFAIKSHGDQKYGESPYSVHLDAVAMIASKYGETAETIAYLHDVVEDTKVQLSEIEECFGALVSEAVAILTDEPGNNRSSRKAKTYAKMAEVTGTAEIALIVKAADRLANIRACVADDNRKLLEMYKAEHAAFKAAVFRSNICSEIWQEIDLLVEA
ncbi:MAG: HD domain-containing protein [Pseudomonadales bacterium]|nr:HD domain-containing protein [Pseudomonadales bacterium]